MALKIFAQILLFCSVQHLAAQVPDTLKTIDLQTIYISKLHFNDSLQKAPASIGILTKNDLARNNATDISTVINTIPGMYMQSANITTNRITIRGVGARTPFGTNKIRAFYGPIPLTSGDSETTIDDIDLDNIQQVEVIKGPLSSIYGAGLGGAILISPKLSAGLGQKFSANAIHGSYGLLKNTFTYSLQKNNESFYVSYHKLQTDGWRQNARYRREGITVSAELFRKSKSKMTYFGNYTFLKANIPSSIDQKTFEENPKAAATTWLLSKGYKSYRSVLNGLSYEFKLIGNIKNVTAVFINYKDNYEARPFDILRQYTLASGVRTQFSGDFKIVKIKSHFVAGMEYFSDDYAGETIENLYKKNNGQGSIEGKTLTETTQKRNFYNVFAQLRVAFSKKWELQTGLNINTTNFTLNTTFPAEIGSQNYSYNSIYSPQVSLLFQPNPLQSFYISASQGFSLPSVNETLTASGAVNASIKPEKGYNFEIGSKLYFFHKSTYIELALYRMQIKDLLIAQRIADDQYVGVNAGETLHQGIEISVHQLWQINSFLSANAYVSASIGQYQFLSFTDRGNNFSGNQLTGVPANKVNAGFILNTSIGWYFSSDFQFVDKIPLNDSNSIYSNAYKILNLKIGYHFKILSELTAHLAFGINNISNEKYASLILPNAVAPPTGTPRYYYPGLPINYYANIALAYSF